MVGHKALTKDKIKDQTTMVAHLTPVHGKREAGKLKNENKNRINE